MLALESRVGEDLSHVGAKHTHIVVIINSSTINTVFEDTVDLLPSRRSLFAFSQDFAENLLSSFEITIREFVVLDPALRDVSSSLLDQSMEPTQDEQQLGPLRSVRSGGSGRNHRLEGPVEVVLDTRRGLVGNLDGRLQQD